MLSVGALTVISATGFALYMNKGGCPDPKIKGNVSSVNGAKIYHTPGSSFYDKTVIDPTVGEKMFCTEEEAKSAGWRKSQR